MDGASNGQETAYERYTDYNTAEIGAKRTDKNGNSWERKTFSSREDNVNITSLTSLNGAKINLTLTVDDIARMSNEGGVQSVLADLRYCKIVDEENGDYIGISAHYPYYKNSTLNNAGFGGVTRVVVKGGEKTYVFGTTAADSFANPNGGATETKMNLGKDKKPAIKITDADEVYLITKSELDKNIGTFGDFEKNDANPEYINKLIADTAAVVQKYDGNAWLY